MKWIRSGRIAYYEDCWLPVLGEGFIGRIDGSYYAVENTLRSDEIKYGPFETLEAAQAAAAVLFN